MRSGELYWSLVDKIWDDISIYDGPEIFLSQFKSAPEVHRNLFAAHWCQSEVWNGGLHQFFSNSTGVLAPEAAAAFTILQMPELSAVLLEAMQWFGPQYPRAREIREGTLAAFAAENPDDWDPFNELDDRFYDLIETENRGFVAAADAYAAKSDGSQ